MRAALHVISDRVRHAIPLIEALALAAAGGADVLQIRDKRAPAAETYELCLQLQARLKSAGLQAHWFINDRVDVALATAAKGVHLAAKSLPVPAVKALAARAQWAGLVGCSVHSLDEALAAEEAGADYVTFGHVYASESHPGVPPRGVSALARVVERLTIPVIAIGGIDRSNVDVVLDTGCSGVAVIGAVLNQPDPCAATRQLRERIESARTRPKYPFPLLGQEV